MMASSPSELSLDCKPHSYSMLLKSVGEQNITDQHHTQKLEEFLSRLEEERLKIDAFKRELPLCMQLLSNAMDAYKQQLQSCKANQGPKPVLEEFIPLKHGSLDSGSEKAASIADKANWMTSAQLWSTNNIQPSEGIVGQESPVQQPKQRMINNGGAFHPFMKEGMGLPDLALANSGADKAMELDQKNVNGGSLVKGGGQDQTDAQTNNNSNSSSQTHRKARRCWSPDLHRRFVNALQMLGGSQVATPKQIRELMKVDGLTNDEVKSHLQKYRLHTRRPGPSPQAAAAAAGQPQLVVLGSIWVPPEYANAAHAGAPVYSAHPTAHAPAHYSQEFYPAAAQAHQVAHGHHQLHHQLHHQHSLHNQLHIYNAPPPPPMQQSSPDSDVRGSGERSESIEDGKSESGSWKVDSNGGGGDRKAMVVREELGEESNASDITLKF